MIGLVIKAYKDFLKSNSKSKYKDELLRISYKDTSTIDWGRVAWSDLGKNEGNFDNDIHIYKNYQSIVAFFAGRKGLSPIENQRISSS